MQSKEKIFEDLARVAGSTVTILSEFGQQFRDDMRTRLEELAVRLDLVPREDFNRLETMIKSLQERVETLEKQNKKPAAPKTKKAKAI